MTERDPVIARALATLEAPEHGEPFWNELDERLAEVADELKHTPGKDRSHTVLPGSDQMPAVVVDLDRDNGGTGDSTGNESSHRTRRGRLRTWLPAAAAVAVLAAVGVQVVNEPDDTGPNLSVGDPTVSPSTTATPTTTEAPATPLDPAELQAAESTVTEWLDAIGRGDIDTSAGMLGPRSEDFVAAAGGDTWLGTVAGEGYGAWGRSTDRQVSTIAIGPGEAVVVVSGTIELEGTPEQRADAIPAVYAESAAAWLVDPWVTGSTDREWLASLRAPQRGVAWPVTPPVAGHVDIYLDGERVVSADTVPGTEHESAVADFPRVADPGEQIATVVFASNDGAVFLAESRYV